ncbi:hypothetical protein GCM10007167_15390 [Vulcaniibacterium thermophilum]|uniref:NnrS family protein n=2 Tax=Vulcaniibacterium thermophilum TaxID=1169913 RepID=A0A919DB91_9GAMM|nr:hypothetical protein GCM10007167_15390 [Vulcaniibacterium thermophilum]
MRILRRMQTATPPRPLSPRLLAAAPHRLMFFVGASNVLLAMLWWFGWLAAARGWIAGYPQPEPYAGWLHAFVMQYQMLASFIFGFLLTVFPRWMGLPEPDRWRYVPVGAGLFGGQIVTLLGALGWDAGVLVGTLMTLAGWLAALSALAPLLWQERGATWHARACFGALWLGLIGLGGWLAFLLGASPSWAFAAIKIGSFGFLLPIYFTVAHRMFPFFAGNAVQGYTMWRPFWLLGAVLALALAHLGLELVHGYAWLWLPDLGLLALTLLALARWWPRGAAPGLLRVLFLGLLWLPVAFALYAGQSLVYAASGAFLLGRAPAHALFVGFFGSVLIAMVTRVTQGHSGRPLVMPKVAWYAFWAIQGVTLMRLGAELADDGMTWQALSAAGWLVALAPWIVRLGRIYLAPRADGRPG